MTDTTCNELDKLLEETISDPVSWDELKRKMKRGNPVENWWLDA